MITPNIPALDVDGLRCDGMREYCSIAPRTVRYAIAINASRVRKSSCAGVFIGHRKGVDAVDQD